MSMTTFDYITYTIIGILIIVIGSFSLPLVFNTTTTEKLTIVFNDYGGIIDSCGNFYSAGMGHWNSKTNAIINQKLKMGDGNVTPVTFNVKVTRPTYPYLTPSIMKFGYPRFEIIDDTNYSFKGECHGN
jgi:hypothetical protein